MMADKPKLLDVVELREPRGGQPAGAIGTVIELFSTAAEVEFVEKDGRTLDLLTVAFETLRIRESDSARRRTAG